jgi:hypothetical protein
MPSKKTVGYAKYRLSPLKKITDLAKQIRKKNPSMKYTDAVKKAGAQYRAGVTAKPAAKKKTAVKGSAAKKAVVRKVKAKKTARKKTTPVSQGKLFGLSNSNQAIANIKDLQAEILRMQATDLRYKAFLKNRENTKTDKVVVKRQMMANADYIRTLKKQVQQLKKHIK